MGSFVMCYMEVIQTEEKEKTNGTGIIIPRQKN